MVEPAPTSDLNKQLQKVVQRSGRAIWSLIIAEGVFLTVVSILAGFLVVQYLHERERIQQVVAQTVSSQCQLFYSLGVSQPQQNTTKFGIQLIADSRLIVHGLGCPQKLPPPSPALLQDGRKYHVPIVR